MKSRENTLNEKGSHQNTRYVLWDQTDQDDTEEEMMDSHTTSTNVQRHPIYVTLRGREVYSPDRFQN